MMRLQDVPRPPPDAKRTRYAGSAIPHDMIDAENQRWRVADDGEILVYIEYDERPKCRIAEAYYKPGLPF